ncbi:hypothetical protein CsSME_00029108 [Camellia sinensis var. sinensis]
MVDDSIRVESHMHTEVIIVNFYLLGQRRVHRHCSKPTYEVTIYLHGKMRSYLEYTSQFSSMESHPCFILPSKCCVALNYDLDNFAGLNMKVCLGMGLAQLLIWAIWAGITCHPSRWRLWIVVIGGGIATLLEIYDFPPYSGFVDAHALWHATTIPLTYLWWSFIRDDAEFRTTTLIKKAK